MPQVKSIADFIEAALDNQPAEFGEFVYNPDTRRISTNNGYKLLAALGFITKTIGILEHPDGETTPQISAFTHRLREEAERSGWEVY